MSNKEGDEKDAEDYLKRGKNEFDKRRYSIAIEFFNKVLELNPENSVAWKLKGESLLNQYEFSQSLECSEKALRLDINNNECWRLKIAALSHLNRHEESLFCCDEALKRFPNEILLWFWNGLNSKTLNQESYSSFKRALILCDEKLNANPDDIETWCLKGEILWWMDRSQESLECSDKVLEINPKHEMAFILKAAALFKLAMNQEAIKTCDKILRTNPRNATAWNIKGSCLANQKKYQKAIECYNKAIELNPYDLASSHSKTQCLLALNIRLCPTCNNETSRLSSLAERNFIYICPNAKIISEKPNFPILPCYGKKPKISKSWLGPKCPNCKSTLLRYASNVGFFIFICPNALTKTADGTLFITCKSYEDNL